ncbi:MAG: hypothetical protein V4598_19720 [Bdellovibrionota bacterium]
MKFLLSLILLSSFSFAEEETDFDKFVDKQKKENLSIETREKLEAKPNIVPKDGETKFDQIMDKTLKNEKPKRKEGLIDPLIDGAKEASDSGKKKIEEVTGKILRSEDLRDDSFGTLLLGYQPFTTWIPSKWTASYTQIFNRNWTLEGEYSKGSLSVPVFSVDIGEIKEERVSLQSRYYPGNSFNWSFGLMYQKGEAKLGADIPATTKLDVFEMESFGATLGFGNRWQWQNGFTLGIDWFRMNQPLFGRWENESVLKTVSADDADELKKIMRAFNTLPTFVFLGLQLGYTF